jgi:formate/nitrite transporter
VFLGNIVGSLVLVALMYLTKQWSLDGNMVGAKGLLIANAKVNLGFVEAFARGILCNALVVLAVWLCFGARSTTDKVLAIIFPITAFVASGFEHSIANAYFIPMGMMLKGQPAVVAAAEAMSGQAISLVNLTWGGFLLKNLLPVTLGNIVGGSILVGLVYWSIYLR